MNVLFQEIKPSLLNLVGAGIEALPRILVAIAFLMFTSWAAKFARLNRSLIFSSSVGAWIQTDIQST